MSKTCTHPGCDRAYSCKGYCARHYARMRKGIDMDLPWLEYQGPEASFWEKVQKSDHCWSWTGAKSQAGYGQMRVGGRLHLAHRLSYAWHRGEIPEGSYVDHKCWNALCVNPDHLRLATPGQNLQNLKGANSNSTSGYRGVHWVSREKKWRATAGLNGKVHYLGLYDYPEEAARIASDWRSEHMPYSQMDKKKEPA